MQDELSGAPATPLLPFALPGRPIGVTPRTLGAKYA